MTQGPVDVPDGLALGEDGVLRCAWSAGQPDYRRYHDEEWGRAVHGEVPLFERITLEAFQSGLSWLTILRKRGNFRAAFAEFDPASVAAFDERDVERLMQDSGIVRNRRKIEATLANARALVAMRERGERLDSLFWDHAPADRSRPGTPAGIPTQSEESVRLSRELKSRGFAHIGPTTMYAAMQACGLVDDHLEACQVGVR